MDKLSHALKILQTLQSEGYESYFAGGCVRDSLLGATPKDFDIATSATPEIVQKLFPKTVPVGVQFGVVLVVDEGEHFEVATFRTESDYDDGRRPSKVSFATVEEDARRRDFTVNGLYWDGRSERQLDLVEGAKDLAAKRIRAIGDPNKRFQEDHLRLLRAVRFAVQLGFEIEPGTLAAVKANAELIRKTSPERVRDELGKMLTSPDPARGMRLLDETGLLIPILPEVETLKGVEQPSQYHPEGDVYVHTLMLLEGCTNAPLELALGALFHDIAKPATFVRATDRIRFHGHDKIGADMTRDILKRLAFPNDQIELVCALVLQHLKFKDAFQMKISTLKRFFSMDRFDLHMELHRLDCMASHKNLDAYEFCKAKLAEYGTIKKETIHLVDGKDLIELGHKPGPGFSKILRVVEDAALEGKIKTREEALELVKRDFPASGART